MVEDKLLYMFFSYSRYPPRTVDAPLQGVESIYGLRAGPNVREDKLEWMVRVLLYILYDYVIWKLQLILTLIFMPSEMIMA